MGDTLDSAGIRPRVLWLSDSADVTYKCTTPYHAASNRSVRWDDPGSCHCMADPLELGFRCFPGHRCESAVDSPSSRRWR